MRLDFDGLDGVVGSTEPMAPPFTPAPAMTSASPPAAREPSGGSRPARAVAVASSVESIASLPPSALRRPSMLVPLGILGSFGLILAVLVLSDPRVTSEASSRSRAVPSPALPPPGSVPAAPQAAAAPPEQATAEPSPVPSSVAKAGPPAPSTLTSPSPVEPPRAAPPGPIVDSEEDPAPTRREPAQEGSGSGFTLPFQFALNALEPSMLPAQGSEQLDASLHSLAELCGAHPLELTGHTDNRGSPRLNRYIGLERARHVRALLQHTIQRRITVSTAGSTRPIATNETTEGQLANRRVTAACAAPSKEGSQP